MIEIYDEFIGDIPVIHAVPAGKRYQTLPTIFHFHGYTSSKELNSFFGYAFARAGFRVVLPEAIEHGDRFDGNIERRRFLFWQILKNNIDEFEEYVSHYQQQGLILDDKVAVSGTSMGGFTVLGLLARYNHIKAAACYMGSGFFSTLSHELFPPIEIKSSKDHKKIDNLLANLYKLDSSKNITALAQQPLMLWHGRNDEIVSVAETERLHSMLLDNNLTNNVNVIIDETASHKVPMNALEHGVSFFKKTLL
ncbi:esterase [Pantoea sp. CCBC3-3-1]|uniref:esterase n=1 Tax=Pantoea sp. CCBC3-3-1 TaxID=2490851 RepID=UPI0011BF7CA4|nr:esterase [Pantoea sp. CCBC3-3-1]